MKVPSTLDLRRRRGPRRPAVDDGYEYVEVDDPDAVELGDDWEWVEVEVDEEPEVEADAVGPGRSSRPRRGGWRRLLAGLPTSEADVDIDVRDERATPPETETAEPDGDDGWDDGWDDAEWDDPTTIAALADDDPVASGRLVDDGGPPSIRASRPAVTGSSGPVGPGCTAA